MNFLFIIALGRSGSTTLQRIFSTIPKSNICGENHNEIFHLLEFYNSAKLTDRRRPKRYDLDFEKREEKHVYPAWYNSFNMTDIKNKIKELILAYFDNQRENEWIGFKNIRFGNLSYIDDFMDFFPNTKVVVNISTNTTRQSQSAWWGKHEQSSKQYLERENQKLVEYCEGRPSLCRLAVLERFDEETYFETLFRFLNATYDHQFVQKILVDKLDYVNHTHYF